MHTHTHFISSYNFKKKKKKKKYELILKSSENAESCSERTKKIKRERESAIEFAIKSLWSPDCIFLKQLKSKNERNILKKKEEERPNFSISSINNSSFHFYKKSSKYVLVFFFFKFRVYFELKFKIINTVID